MCDQLSTVGVEFSLKRLTHIFTSSLAYSFAHPYPYVPQSSWNPLSWLRAPLAKRWGVPAVCQHIDADQRHDWKDCDGAHRSSPSGTHGSKEALWKKARPWGLGQLRYPTSKVQLAAGTAVRHPGLFKRADETAWFNSLTDEPLLNTNERIHSSVRVRLACEGLSLDDAGVWKCEALTQGSYGRPLWKLEHRSGLDRQEATALREFVPNESKTWAREYAKGDLYNTREGDGQWRWVHVGDGQPHAAVLPEEPLVGYWEKLLLALTAGEADVWRWAEENPPSSVLIDESGLGTED